MHEPQDSELNQLLSRGRLSGIEYDRVERLVLDRVVPKAPRRFWPVVVPAAAALAAAAAFLLIDRGVTLRDAERGSPESGGFTTKSDGRALNGVVTTSCGRTNFGSCRLGDTLFFSIAGRTRPGYLVAYAERVDDPHAERILYFPKSSGAAPPVEVSAGTTVLREGIRLGEPHTRGHYRLTAWIAEVPVEPSALEGEPPAHAQRSTFDID
jgi:hypothetical protein